MGGLWGEYKTFLRSNAMARDPADCTFAMAFTTYSLKPWSIVLLLLDLTEGMMFADGDFCTDRRMKNDDTSPFQKYAQLPCTNYSDVKISKYVKRRGGGIKARHEGEGWWGYHAKSTILLHSFIHAASAIRVQQFLAFCSDSRWESAVPAIFIVFGAVYGFCFSRKSGVTTLDGRTKSSSST